MHRDGDGRHQGVREAGRRVLRTAPEQHRGHQAGVLAERGPGGVAVRRQLPPPVGGEQELPGGGEVAGVGGQVEEDFGHVRGVWREQSAAGYGRREHLSVGFEYVHDDAGHYLSGCCHAKVSFFSM